MKTIFIFGLFSLSTYVMAANEDLYRELINSALNHPPLCLGEHQWPVSIENGRDSWLTARMTAFADAGLIQAHPTSGKTIWQLTKYGKAEHDNKGDFCYGRQLVKNFIHAERIENNSIKLIFSYTIKDLPPWALHKSFRMANTDIDNLIMGIEKAHYQAIITRNRKNQIELVGQPEQLELYY